MNDKTNQQNKEFNTDESFERERERNYENSRERFSDAELIQIIPEAISYLKDKFSSLKEQHKKLASEISKDLNAVYAIKDEVSRDFWEQVVEVLKGEKLNELKKETERLRFLLFPPKESGARITENQIRRAKEYPLNRLIETRRNMARCPFHHPDNRPSFSIKNNFGHCFACGWSGDTIKFLMDTRALNFKQAVEMLS